MFHILVPVDFYKTSFSAFYYAAEFSKLFPEAEITLLHVMNGSFDSNEIIVFDTFNYRKDAALKRVDYFSKTYPEKLGLDLEEITINKEVRFGVPEITIAEYAKEHHCDLIIMGTRDQHNLFDKILGSASSITIRTAHCPVMLIHENVRFNIPKKIVFAFDSKSELENALEEYRKLNLVLKAKTDFIHVDSGKDNDVKNQMKEIVEELFEDHDSTFSFEVKTIENGDLITTLKDYCLFEKADILAMMHRKEGVFKNMFRTMNSVRMAQEFHLPVIVFHEDD